MVSLQWGSTVSYDILVFDKAGKVAFIEVKSSAAYSRRWILQKKYATPEADAIPLKRRFVCCVDLAVVKADPKVYVFPASAVAAGLHYYLPKGFPKSDSYHLSLDFKPQGSTKQRGVLTVGQHIQADEYLERYDLLGVQPVTA